MLDAEDVIIRESEKEAARIAYDHAREVYKQRIVESE